MIPILDLTRQYGVLKAEIDAATQAVFASGNFINGANCRAFESEFAAYVGTSHAVGLNSGTDALHLGLRALGIGPGDEVITSPFTFVATTEAIGMTGAAPVFVDIDPDSFNIDPSRIEAAITNRTRAIIPIHLYGRPAPMREIMELARAHHLAVVEDCAQAVGARIDGQLVGTFGDVGAFSFFPSKNLGAYGDGGMATMNRSDLAERVRSLRAHGGRVKYHHEELGVNSRLDELQAAILRVKLPHLDQWIDARRAAAERYTRQLSDVVRVPGAGSETYGVYHQYTIRVRDRDGVQSRLANAGVQTMVYYPVPLHLQEVHRQLGYRGGDFPHAEAAAQEALSLPMFPELLEREQAEVVRAVRASVEVEAVV
ncbi:MAG TPA: DegT/DnrJ/EryC1/StrS family aminotransferase [Alphaproteobacteria bacterium]|nr:DegT/DnrJ/EryC1/StrS family aminotransferase [Alphaproteobacteria bacterium]